MIRRHVQRQLTTGVKACESGWVEVAEKMQVTVTIKDCKDRLCEILMSREPGLVKSCTTEVAHS